jgi:hypothetical protein
VQLHVIPWAAHIPPHIPQFCSYTHSKGLVRTARIRRSHPQHFYAFTTRIYPLSAALRRRSPQSTVQQSAATAHPYQQLLRTLTRSHCPHSPHYLIGEDWWMQSSLFLCIATSEMYINPGCRAIVIHLTFTPHHLHCASNSH